MSLNHFSTGTDFQGTPTPWWPHQQQPTQTNHNSSSNHNQQQQFSPCPSHHLYQQQQQQISSMFSAHTHPAFTFNLNQEDTNDDQEAVLDDQTALNMEEQQQAEAGEVEKELMFEKPLTPSDVGKLNRLVIPKQHAEKYFPLGGGGGGDSGDKGLLLSFEDESGKCWRFRYSYWNSSQSYVLTKGWSRYVKEKRLDAGDIILFERHRTDTERLFIGWRRRGASTTAVVQDSQSGGGGGGWSRGLYSGTVQPYPAHAHGVTVPHHAGSMGQNQAAAPVGNLRTLRLFGVNMECQLDESEPSTPDGSSLSSQQGQGHTHNLQQLNYSQAYSSNRHNHMDITFSQDVNQMMRNRQG